jgi:hypothetical protein
MVLSYSQDNFILTFLSSRKIFLLRPKLHNNELYVEASYARTVRVFAGQIFGSLGRP